MLMTYISHCLQQHFSQPDVTAGQATSFVNTSCTECLFSTVCYLLFLSFLLLVHSCDVQVLHHCCCDVSVAAKNPEGAKIKTCPQRTQARPFPPPQLASTLRMWSSGLSLWTAVSLAGSTVIPEWRMMMAAVHCKPHCGRALKSCNRQIVT